LQEKYEQLKNRFPPIQFDEKFPKELPNELDEAWATMDVIWQNYVNFQPTLFPKAATQES